MEKALRVALVNDHEIVLKDLLALLRADGNSFNSALLDLTHFVLAHVQYEERDVLSLSRDKGSRARLVELR